MGAIRLFLASVVVLAHVQAFIAGPAGHAVSPYLFCGMNGGRAVVCFFVVSGFLISYALSRKYIGPGALRDFYRARFFRIFPLYWAVVALFVAFDAFGARYQLVEQAHNGNVLDLFSGLFLFGADWRVEFAHYPALDWLALPSGLAIAWTLSVELTFYVMAPFVLHSLPRSAALFSLSCLVRGGLVTRYGFDPVLTYMFIPTTLCFFMLGHLARLAYDNYLHSVRFYNLGFGISAIVFLQFVAQPLDDLYFYGFIISFALFLPYAFARTKDARLLNFLGDLSYPVYLCHPFVLFLIYGLDRWQPLSEPSALDRILGARLPEPMVGTVSALIALAAVISVAAILHLAIEVPLKLGIQRIIPAGAGLRAGISWEWTWTGRSSTGWRTR
jgi:peptidoglycan/LPS O-acetylase OafA/YrhL